MFDFICPPNHIPLCVGVLERVDEAVACCHGSGIMKEDYKFHLFIYLFFNWIFISVNVQSVCQLCTLTHSLCVHRKWMREMKQRNGTSAILGVSRQGFPSVNEYWLGSHDCLKTVWCSSLKTSMPHIKPSIKFLKRCFTLRPMTAYQQLRLTHCTSRAPEHNLIIFHHCKLLFLEQQQWWPVYMSL